MRDANRQIAEFARTTDDVEYLDVDTPMIGSNGRPLPELFVEDGLHMTQAGYAIWSKLLRPMLVK